MLTGRLAYHSFLCFFFVLNHELREAWHAAVNCTAVKIIIVIINGDSGKICDPIEQSGMWILDPKD